MTGIPGLSPLLHAAGKRVEGWHDGAGHLRVDARTLVRIPLIADTRSKLIADTLGGVPE